MSDTGTFEIIIISILGLIVYTIPLAAIVWIIITLNRLRKGQETIQNRLDAIEQFLNRDRS